MLNCMVIYIKRLHSELALNKVETWTKTLFSTWTSEVPGNFNIIATVCVPPFWHSQESFELLSDCIIGTSKSTLAISTGIYT